jgi:L-ascorbate metabolism protein UlaG (beta-lactamase superfamily)
MLNFLYSALLTGCFPAARLFSSPQDEKDGPVDFNSLKDLDMREIAKRKLHHGSKGRFLNPLGAGHPKRGLGRLLYWKLFDTNRFKPYMAAQPVNPVEIDWQPIRDHRGLSVTYLNHASVLIKDIDSYLIVDPVFDGLFWFIRDHSPLAFDPGELPPVDHVLVTHGHYDHLDKPSLSQFHKDTHLISPLGYGDIFRGLGMTNHSALDWYGMHRDGSRTITLLPCNHWTMRNPIAGPNRALWGSFLIQTSSGKSIYISGDTAWFDRFHEIGRDFEIDLAVFNLGAYEPRWFMAQSHINPQETVRAFKALNAKKLMIVHWGTFQLGDEPVHFPPMDLKRELQKEGLLDRWVQKGQGETYFFPS